MKPESFWAEMFNSLMKGMAAPSSRQQCDEKDSIAALMPPSAAYREARECRLAPDSSARRQGCGVEARECRLATGSSVSPFWAELLRSLMRSSAFPSSRQQGDKKKSITSMMSPASTGVVSLWSYGGGHGGPGHRGGRRQ